MSHPVGILADTQASGDTRGIVIDRVGIKAVRQPIEVPTGTGGLQSTVAQVEMYVELAAGVKGTHMSRFLETLATVRAPLDFEGMRHWTSAMLERLGAERGQLIFRFPYFIAKAAPVSGVVSLMDYEVALSASSGGPRAYRFELTVCVPVTSLCPCSKEISRYGAHNQRSHVTISASLRAAMSIEELVRIAEDAASCELYGLLKRPDEKFVTERAYENPKFVEDLVRDIAVRLDAEPRVGRYQLSAENFESIHNHSAYAEIERDKTAPQEQRSHVRGARESGTRLVTEVA